MPAGKRPSFLKRQKEQKRTERAAEKREARRLKKHGGETKTEEIDGTEVFEPLEGMDDGAEPETTDEEPEPR